MATGKTGGPLNVCVVGGGAAGVGLIWTLAKAKSLGVAVPAMNITLVHCEDSVGGHSNTYNTTLGGQSVAIDLGVQMVAPKMYPIVMSMLALPEFADIRMVDVPLNISCFFPEVDGVIPYWGNFPAYQTTPLAQGAQHDIAAFDTLLSAETIGRDVLDYIEPVAAYLSRNSSAFDDLAHFETYFLDPYMSIMNGYGNALLESVVVGDIAPLWDLGYASFTNEVTGYGRFQLGAESWVQKMWTLAQQGFGTALNAMFSTTVVQLYPSAQGPTIVTVDSDGKAAAPVPYDIVVSTLDMHTNSTIMNNSANGQWSAIYADAIGTTINDSATDVWALQPGMCYLHQDQTVLAPNPNPSQKRPETLQFTATYAAAPAPEPYDLSNTYATYIESNLMGVDVEDPTQDLYLSMYGYDPAQQGVRVPASPIRTMPWNHGMWLPSFMIEAKFGFHHAQSSSPYHDPYAYQQDTGIYFAGNNLTMDSEEGALISGMAIAKYAFGVDPISLLTPPQGTPLETLIAAALEFGALYNLLLFPPALVTLGQRIGHLGDEIRMHWAHLFHPGSKPAS
jgi:hypothetical protein